ncbi:MAG: hypothetical protein JWR00_3163, partial [Rubritepida sp.]|nr:hypothetical protein [Rubritepida sp.]
LVVESGGSVVGPAIRMQAGFNFGTNAPDPAAAGGIQLAGFVGSFFNGTADVVEMAAGTSGIVQTGGQIRANTLSIQSGGDALLTGASTSLPNVVNLLFGVDVAGNFALDNGISSLQVGTFGGGTLSAQTFTILTAGDVFIFAPVAATERATFRVGHLSIQSSSGPSGSITAPLVEIAPFAQVRMEVYPNEIAILPPELFLLSPVTVQNISTSTLRLGATTFNGATTTTASVISFTSGFSFAGTVDARATGNVFQGAGTTVNLGTLTGAAGGSFQLTEPTNVLPVVSDLSAGTVLALRTTGSQELTGNISAPNVVLTTGGSLTETGAGRITGGTLALRTGGSATLLGANALTGLAASNVAGNLQLNNTSAQLYVPGGNLVFASDFLSISQTGELLVDGTVSGQVTSLAATTHLQINGHSAIARNGDLTLQSDVFGLNGLLQATGAIRINAGTSANLAGTASGSLLSITSPSITFGGLGATNTPVRLFLGAGGSATGTLDASALSVFGGASANLFGTIGGIAGGPAAATGRRGTSGGTLLVEPLPSPTLYLFNNCSIGATLCMPIIVPPADGGGSAVGGGGTITPPPVSFVFAPFAAPSVNPLLQAAVLDPTATLVQQLRPPVPVFSFGLFRDRSEEGELAPPNVRAEDF